MPFKQDRLSTPFPSSANNSFGRSRDNICWHWQEAVMVGGVEGVSSVLLDDIAALFETQCGC